MNGRMRFHRLTEGIGLFAFGIETYRYEDEAHFSWGSQSLGSHRAWALNLGRWQVTYE